MNLRNICRRDVVSLDEQSTLQEAAIMMRAHHVGALVVTASDGDSPRVVGMITDRDLAIEVLARAVSPGSVKVGQVASRRLASVTLDDGLTEVVKAMEDAGVRRLLVTEENGRLAGVISSDDVLEALAADLGTMAHAMRAGISRETAERPQLTPPGPRPVFLPQGTPGWRS